MSITNIKFANGLVYEDINGNYFASVLSYNSGSHTHSYKLTQCNAINFDFASSVASKRLITFKDGSHIDCVYTYTHEPGTGASVIYTFSADFVAYDKNGEEVQRTTGGTRTTTVNPEHMHVAPFTEAYYYASMCDWYNYSADTMINDPAASASLMGFLLFKNPQPPAGGYLELTPNMTVDKNTLDGSYTNWFSGLGVVTDDSGITTYFTGMDPDDKWHYIGDEPPEPDPSDTGGGDTPSGYDGDPIDFPDLPSTGVIDCGLITLFNPSKSNLQSLAQKLWSNDFESSINKILNDPFDGIIGLTMVPFTPTTSGSINCYVGNYNTEISMPVVSAQYVTLNGGSVTIPENWKNALDYNATSIDMFIPFVGFRPLSIEDCMGKTISLKYNVDVLSGSGVAIVKCGNKCLYNFPCKLSYDVPLTGSNKAALYTGIINVAMTGLAGAAAGGVMGAVGGAASSAINVATSKQSNIERSGAITSNTGFLGDFVPYVVLHRPIQSLPQNFKTIKGYMSNITMTLSSCVGYTEIDYIHLTGIDGATDTELNEIEALLKKGVII